MISKREELPKIKVDITNIRYKIDNNNPVKTLELICEKMAMGKRQLIPVKKAQIEDN